MTRTFGVFGGAVLAIAFGHALAIEEMPQTKVSMETCLAAALKAQPGEVKELEMSLEDGVPHYEFEINTADGRETEVECDAMTGKIVEVEWENENMDVDAFLTNAKVTPAQAREIVLARVPGKVEEVDMETTSTGVMSYEFEVITPSGDEVDVEVNALTGDIIEVETEVYEIGD